MRKGQDGTMGLFRRTQTRRTTKPTWAERRAAERTARAEARLVQTEQRIHELAAEVRSQVRQPAPE